MNAATTWPRVPGQPDATHALSTSGLSVEALELRTLAIAGVGDDEDVGVVGGHVAGDHRVTLPQPDAAHPGRVPTHRPHVLLAETDGHAVARHLEEVVLPRRCHHPDQLVTLAQVDRDEALAPRLVVLAQGGLLDLSLCGGEEEVLVW